MYEIVKLQSQWIKREKKEKNPGPGEPAQG